MSKGLGPEQEEAIKRLFERLTIEFGAQAGRILQVFIEELGGMRLYVPNLQALYRAERDRRIRIEFNGRNHEELAIKYRLNIRQIRRVVQEG